MMSDASKGHFTYPLVTSLVLVIGFSVLVRSAPSADAMIPDPPYTQEASELPGVRNPLSSGPAFNTSGINQRNLQIELLEAILDELRATRKFLESGSARVTVTDLDIDFSRMSDLLRQSDSSVASPAADEVEVAQSGATTNQAPGTSSGTGVVRRLQGGTVVSEQATE